MQDPTQNEYGFYGRFRSEFPSQVIIDVTDICNLACAHCPHSEFVKTKYYTACFLDAELSDSAVDEVREHGRGITQYIRFTGEGEPLLHKRIHEMLAYAVKNSGTEVSLTTNGTLMNENHVDKLLETRVHVVDISIDAFSPETYAKIRVKGDLEVTRSNVLNLIQRSKHSDSATKVVVSYIEQPGNIHETADYERFWKDHGADFVVVRRLHSGAGMIDAVADAMRGENDRQIRRPCTYPWERIVLNPRGSLSFCPADWKHESTVADYRASTIKEVWQGKALRELREAHVSNDYSKHPFCGQCPDWKATRWPREGRSYADMMEDFKAAK